MPAEMEKRWIKSALVVWFIALAVTIGVALYVHRRAAAILDFLVASDPAPSRQALYLRLEADRLVHQAYLRHEAVTSGTAGARDATGTLLSEVVPLLERAERLYLESLDAATSQPGILFQLSEVSFLRGQRARGYLYLARYWEMAGERGLARAYRRLASERDPSATISLPDEIPTSALPN